MVFCLTVVLVVVLLVILQVTLTLLLGISIFSKDSSLIVFRCAKNLGRFYDRLLTTQAGVGKQGFADV